MIKSLAAFVTAASFASAMTFAAAPASAGPISMAPNGVKWCPGEWHCDPKGCVCVTVKKPKGGTSALSPFTLK